VKEVVASLTVNTSIVTMEMSLSMCAIPDIALFSDFIQSTPRLKELRLSYDATDFNDSEDVQDQYQTQVNHILGNVLKNPSIKTLHLIGCSRNNPQALYELLSNSKTITSFYIRELDPTMTPEIAFAVAGGLSRNPSLKEVHLEADHGPLDIAISGIGFASSIESLSVSQCEEPPSEEMYLAIAKALNATPSLKTLEIRHEDSGIDVDAAPIDPVFWTLPQPGACTGLEKWEFTSAGKMA
jgi:hypothetical protein